MKSIDKLKRLTGETDVPTITGKPGPGPASASSEKQARIDDLRRRMDNIDVRAARSRAMQDEKRTRGNRGLSEILSGEEIINEHGSFFLLSDAVRGASRHGHRNLYEVSEFDMTAAGMLANNPVLGDYLPKDALFLDTETTGLSGGTGTMAFLIGLGWFEEGHFQVRQILARDFSEEKAALAYLKEIAACKKFLVTFNGKAFDVNLLATRFIMNRIISDIEILPHLDLLHPSRRLLGHRLENCRLATLESDILGVRREGDIPGWEIPQRYFDWLRRRDPRLLADIFEHNRLDVLSMATLTAHLIEILNAQADLFHHMDDYLAAARLFLQRNHPKGAEKILDGFQSHSCSDFSSPSKKKLAQLYKRTGRIAEAAHLWEQMSACEPVEYYAVSEWAKYLEHHDRNYCRVKDVIEKALGGENAFSIDQKNALEHRLKRIHGKLQNLP